MRVARLSQELLSLTASERPSRHHCGRGGWPAGCGGPSPMSCHRCLRRTTSIPRLPRPPTAPARAIPRPRSRRCARSFTRAASSPPTWRPRIRPSRRSAPRGSSPDIVVTRAPVAQLDRASAFELDQAVIPNLASLHTTSLTARPACLHTSSHRSHRLRPCARLAVSLSRSAHAQHISLSIERQVTSEARSAER